jgi:L-iditol 2-dehydrogenase
MKRERPGASTRASALLPTEAKDQLFDVVIEAAGVKASVEQAFQLVKPGGAIISLGISGDSISYPALRITRSEITIYGTIIYTKKDFEDAIALLRDPAFNVSPILSRIDPFAKYQEAFADALTGNFAKIVLDYSQTYSGRSPKVGHDTPRRKGGSPVWVCSRTPFHVMKQIPAMETSGRFGP